MVEYKGSVSLLAASLLAAAALEPPVTRDLGCWVRLKYWESGSAKGPGPRDLKKKEIVNHQKV